MRSRKLRRYEKSRSLWKTLKSMRAPPLTLSFAMHLFIVHFVYVYYVDPIRYTTHIYSSSSVVSTRLSTLIDLPISYRLALPVSWKLQKWKNNQTREIIVAIDIWNMSIDLIFTAFCSQYYQCNIHMIYRIPKLNWVFLLYIQINPLKSCNSKVYKWFSKYFVTNHMGKIINAA